MTNTDTADAAGTARQVAELAEAGSEIVRITVNNRAAAARVAEIRARLRDEHGVAVPLVGDFHYNGHTLLREFPDCAEALDKYRINPGNVGRGARHDTNFATMIARRRGPRQAGADRRERRLPRPGAARRADGPQRGRADPRERRRRAAPGHGRERAVLGRRRRGARPAARRDRDLGQDQPAARDGGRLPRPGRALRLPPSPGPDRGGHGLEGRRLDHGRARRSCSRTASATPSAPASRRSRAATARWRCRSAARSCRAWASAPSAPR